MQSLGLRRKCAILAMQDERWGHRKRRAPAF
jgi:hypothetical protein